MTSINPPTILSANGTLSTTWSLESATVSIPNSNIEITSRLFNGQLPGATLRIQPGDTLKINFQNLLTDNNGALGYVHNTYSAADETNLHFHGLHVSGELPSDDVTHVVGPGESYDYMTTLPDSHLPGTHWMHPHRHGSTSLQVGAGAASAIVVEDPPDFLPDQIANAPEVMFMAQYFHVNELNRIQEQSNDQLTNIRNAPSNEFTLVNGALQPTISINPGEWTRFRIIWSQWRNGNLDFSIVAQGGCEMQLLAKDGIYIRDYPRAIDMAPIVPGGRADIMVRCRDPSTYYSISGQGGTLATIVTTDVEVESSDLEAWEPPYPAYLSDLRGATVSPGCSCTTEFDGTDTVNGIAFEYGLTLHTSYLGAVVERVMGGQANEHPYHQHVYPFQLTTGYNNNRDAYNQIGDWHDVVMGDGTIRYSPTEFTGKLMVHCHRLIHEDLGMMAMEQVGEQEGGTCSCTAAPGLGLGAIIGIAAGAVLIVAIIVGFCVYRRKRRIRAAAEVADNNDLELLETEK
ncbi:unnamed protein product [Cylindrotheca closterium]|uniref:Plastocyanin-like domain-containing protein n=1 Tax=Cylindrotheca closterium TaxID=2856 RepID=A0AAD2G9A7_9STRA|nr:unnamed protein product [Cylindrotheca closterium]